jgi:hypothetical protein
MSDLITRAKEAMESATPGRRVQFHGRYCEEAAGTPVTAWDTSHDTSLILPNGMRYRDYSHHKHAADASLDALAADLARLAVAAGELVDCVTAHQEVYQGMMPQTLAALARFRAIAEGRE